MKMSPPKVLLVICSLTILGTGLARIRNTEALTWHSDAAIVLQQAHEPRTCGTLDLPETVADQIQLSLERFKTLRGRGQTKQPGSVSIAVYFHVINQGTGVENGDVPARMYGTRLTY